MYILRKNFLFLVVAKGKEYLLRFYFVLGFWVDCYQDECCSLKGVGSIIKGDGAAGKVSIYSEIINNKPVHPPKAG